jgi:lysine 2,3-aminomutase
MDAFTEELFGILYQPGSGNAPEDVKGEIQRLVVDADQAGRTDRIVCLFWRLIELKTTLNLTPDVLNVSRQRLEHLAEKHQAIDEHGVTVGGRVFRALSIVASANSRVEDYLNRVAIEAPSGMELWDQIRENEKRIRKVLGMDDAAWNSYSGQIRHCIDNAETLAELIELPPRVIAEIVRVTRHYRMRLTPYYASLIQPGSINDPVLLQCVPTGEMVDNAGEEIPPVAADHSPARLVDQFYPRVVTIKATNMCAMYCTHCLRIAHIGKKDRVYPDAAYAEALDYIRGNPLIRDVLITGGDAFVLPNKGIRKILGALDEIDHVRMKRLGTRIPVTAPQRVDTELLEILQHSNDRKPLRVVTQINTAQEITPVSKDAFHRISKAVSAVLNQAVLLKGVNDSTVKMWKLCETIQESYVRPYYIFNCSFRNPQFAHFRVPLETGRDIVESMYGNLPGDAIPRYIATAGGKIPLHRDNVMGRQGDHVILKKPWSGESVLYPDADPKVYHSSEFAFSRSQ